MVEREWFHRVAAAAETGASRPKGFRLPVRKEPGVFGVKLAKFGRVHVGLVAFRLRGNEWQSLSTR